MPTVDTVDGRTARRNRNKDAVLDALIEMASEGRAEPPIEDIAERAGVSYRSVYRYFDDRTDLMLSAIARVMGDMWPIFDIEQLGEGLLDERIARLTTVRLAAYRQLAPLTRAAVHLRANEPAVAEGYDQVRSYLRDQLAHQLDPELSVIPESERALVLASLDVMFQFEALDYLANHDGMDDTSISRILARHIRAQLAAD
ncbi:MAG TPA: TetR/AcrR family transcriptional regulator [Ilumatobacteraceae bacterium]|nr:TetR/AcrR family transcriptional regulator [Ilumatobacteraceae bacterium]